jgi:hypothetical protein
LQLADALFDNVTKNRSGPLSRIFSQIWIFCRIFSVFYIIAGEAAMDWAEGRAAPRFPVNELKK